MSAFQFVIIIITYQSGLKPFDLLARPLRKRSNTQRSRNHGMMEQLHEEWQICVGYVALPIAVQHLGGGFSVLLKQYASLSLPKHTFVFTIQVWYTPTQVSCTPTFFPTKMFDSHNTTTIWTSMLCKNKKMKVL